MVKMKIGIVTTWFPSGAGYVSLAYKNVLSVENEVFIFARSGDNFRGNEFWDSGNVHWARQHHRITGIWTNEFKKWIVKNKIETIIFNEQRFWRPILIAKKMGVRVGAYVDYYTQSTVPLFALYDFLLCNTKRHFSVFSWHPNVAYFPWGVDTDRFFPSRNKGGILTFLTTLGVEGENERRGGRIAIKAFLRTVGNVKLIVCCQTPQNLCSKSFLSDVCSDARIEVRYGTFDHLPFNDADVFLYPSRLEGIGLSLPEALSSGLACITTNSAPMNEFVINEYNGYLINVEKYLGTTHGYYWPESIADQGHLTAILQEYIENPDRVKLHGKNAREFALLNLNWRINSEALNSFLKNKFITSPTVEDYNIIYKQIQQENDNNIFEKLNSINTFLRGTIKQKMKK